MEQEFKPERGVFVPSCTVRKNDRLNAIAERLVEGTYDVVLLQEIWTDDDYQKLQDALAYVYRYSNYFHCHTIGSGTCIFSKWPMDNIFFHPYAINGYPHLVHQADWYCGKGVGMVRITTPNEFRINFYVTHLVARYELDRKRDRFHGHRTSQLIELLEFIRITASSSDAVVITGDFNLESNTPDIAFFKSYLGVSDAWKDSIVRYSNGPLSTEISHERLEVEGCTCDRADNPYRNDEWTKYYGNGERLDYIFYRAGNGPLDSESAPKNIQLTCRSSWLDMRQVPNDADKLHYSDHVGVGAQLTISRVSPTTVAQHNRKLSLESTKQMETVLLELADHINSGLQQCRRERILHLIFAAGIAFLLFYILTYGPHRHWFLVFLSFLLVIVLSPCCFLLLWGSLIGRITERRALTNSGIIINLILAQIKACMKQSEGDTHANGDYTILSY